MNYGKIAYEAFTNERFEDLEYGEQIRWHKAARAVLDEYLDAEYDDDEEIF
jgi:hypothetical protein